MLVDSVLDGLERGKDIVCFICGPTTQDLNCG